MKIIAHYDENGWFTALGHANKSPLEKDVYLIPASATAVLPPNYSASELPRFVNGAWQIQEHPSITAKKKIQDELIKKEEEKKAAFDALPYGAKRALEYPEITDVVEAIIEAIAENRPEKLQEIQQKRIAVKAKYPKKV